MRDLSTLSTEELREFFDSFDQILCDVHGVLINVLEEIPGAPEAVRSLQNLGKRFIVVSNNTIVSVDEYQKDLKYSGFEVSKDNIVTPCLTAISYLKKQNFTKKIFVLGTDSMKRSLREAGFEIAPRGPSEIEETFEGIAEASTEDDESVGAVIEDIDLNVNYVNLQRAVTFLKREDVLFLRGCGDVKFSLGDGRVMMGCGVFHRIVEEASGRVPVSVAKPSTHLNEYLVETYKIEDPKRVLFIGDSIPSDMSFAAKFGYQKLLVLTGLTKKESLRNWKYSNEQKPDYYVDSLETVHHLILGVL